MQVEQLPPLSQLSLAMERLRLDMALQLPAMVLHPRKVTDSQHRAIRQLPHTDSLLPRTPMLSINNLDKWVWDLSKVRPCHNSSSNSKPVQLRRTNCSPQI